MPQQKLDLQPIDNKLDLQPLDLQPIEEPKKPIAQAPKKSFGSMLTTPLAPELNEAAAASIPGQIYNRFIRPMSSPIGAALTGIGSVAAGPLTAMFPRASGAVLSGLGGYTAATKIPAAAKDIYLHGPHTNNMLDLAEGVGGAAMIKPGMRMLGKSPTAIAPIPAKVETAIAPAQAELPLAEAELTPVQKLHEAIKQSVPLNKQQKQLYSEERSRRLGQLQNMPVTDQASSNARLSALAGEMPKVKMEPLKLEQPDVDKLFVDIANSPNVIGYDSVKAHTGLTKILMGAVPQNNELDQLRKVFGNDVVVSLVKNLPLIDETKSVIGEAVNLPRALMASVDMSAPFRQGIGLAHKKEFWTSFNDMFRSFGSDKAFRAVQESIESKPTFKLMQDSGLKLTDLTGMSSREEQYMSNWAEKGIPLQAFGKPGEILQSAYANTGGRVVRASNRAYVGFLNKLRADTFDSLVNKAARAGLDPENNRVLSTEIADFINTATGRGSLGKLEKNAELLNSTLFSPRLIASRVKMLNPNTYVQASPMVRKEYLKSLFAIASLGAGVVGLGKAAGGKVSTDPTSSDFGKLRIGNTRLDPFGGYQQYIVAANRLLQNEQTSSTTGKSYELGSKYGLPTRLDVAARFAESKANPIVSFATGMLRGKDFSGQPFHIPNEIANRFTPMIIQDMVDLIKEDPKNFPVNAAWLAPASLGMGLQTYKGVK